MSGAISPLRLAPSWNERGRLFLLYATLFCLPAYVAVQPFSADRDSSVGTATRYRFDGGRAV